MKSSQIPEDPLDSQGLPPGEKQVERLPEEQIEKIETVGAVPSSGGRIETGTMKIDLHCHTEASPDCSTPIDRMAARCRERKVAIQAITDHNTIWGALKLRDLAAGGAKGEPLLTVIVGEEVSTAEGELIGLFLSEPIPAGLTPEETAGRIQAQGGLVLLPHGFDPLKRWRLKPAALQRIAGKVDIIETFNARISRPYWNSAAVAWARARGCLMSAGSDAHTLADIGSAWVEAPRCPVGGPQDLLKALEHGVPVGVWTHPILAFLLKSLDRTRRRLFA